MDAVRKGDWQKSAVAEHILQNETLHDRLDEPQGYRWSKKNEGK